MLPRFRDRAATEQVEARAETVFAHKSGRELVSHEHKRRGCRCHDTGDHAQRVSEDASLRLREGEQSKTQIRIFFFEQVILLIAILFNSTTSFARHSEHIR
eukprot:SAG31_NODE_92_length_26360_cov_29.601881_17_plen_101_part_00